MLTFVWQNAGNPFNKSNAGNPFVCKYPVHIPLFPYPASIPNFHTQCWLRRKKQEDQRHKTSRQWGMFKITLRLTSFIVWFKVVAISLAHFWSNGWPGAATLYLGGACGWRERVKDCDSDVAAWRHILCLGNCGIPLARIGLTKTLQFASGRRGYVLSYVCVF